MRLLHSILLLTSVLSLVACQSKIPIGSAEAQHRIPDEPAAPDIDHGHENENDNMRVYAPMSTVIDKIKTGSYRYWSLAIPPAGPLEIALERGADKTSLWARFKWDGKDIVMHIDDLLATAQQSGPYDRISLPFVWRGRSTSCGTVVVEDNKLRGHLDVLTDVVGVSPPRDIQFGLDGFNLGREGYVEARKEKDLDRDESVLVEEMKRTWEELERDENKADMEYAREHWGALRRIRHVEL